MFDNEKARMESLKPYDAAGQLIVSEYQDSSLWRIQTFLSARAHTNHRSRVKGTPQTGALWPGVYSASYAPAQDFFAEE